MALKLLFPDLFSPQFGVFLVLCAFFSNLFLLCFPGLHLHLPAHRPYSPASSDCAYVPCALRPRGETAQARSHVLSLSLPPPLGPLTAC